MGTNQDDDLIWQKVKNVPKLSKPLAIFCAVINVILPGFGTITASCLTSEEKVSKTQIYIGLLQFLTGVLIVGWIWSMYWSYLLVCMSFEIGEFAAHPGRTPQSKAAVS